MISVSVLAHPYPHCINIGWDNFFVSVQFVFENAVIVEYNLNV